MIIYFINLFVVVVAAHLAYKSRSVALARFFLAVAFISMVLVAGLRDKVVGTDTGGYVRYFNRLQSFDDVLEIGSRMGEYGFWTMTWLVHFISDKYVVYLSAIALLVFGAFQWIITEQSLRIDISFFVFITMGFYTFPFNGGRQGVACAIYALAISPLLKGEFIKYACYVFIAFLFHKTAIVLLPLYFIINRPNDFRNIILIILIGLFIGFSINFLVEYASSFDARYSSYAMGGRGGGYGTVAFSLANAAFFFFLKNSIYIDRYRYDRFLNMYLFGIMIGVVSVILGANPNGILRYRFYFTIAIMFLWPIVFRNLSSKSAFIVGLYFVVTYLIYFAMTTSVFSNLVPYIFNRSLF